MRLCLRTLSICSLGVAFATGCTSFRSVFVHRNECNTAWMQTRHLPGIPITLKVLTHVKVTVTEKHYLTVNTVGGVNQISRADIKVPVRGTYVAPVYTDKIFTVDSKRPAAGTLKSNIKMQPGTQYFESLDYDVEDKTIDAITALVAKIAPGGIFSPASEGGGATLPGLQEIESVVAVKVFDVDDPELEMQISSFLECHVNKAHDAWVVPPDVEQIKRLPLTVTTSSTSQPPLCEGPGCDPNGQQVETLEVTPVTPVTPKTTPVEKDEAPVLRRPTPANVM